MLDHPIGWGATGEVWRGHERVSGAAVAAKLLRPDLVDDPEVVARFVRERTILVSLQHPNLVAVRDLVAEGGSVAIVMDLVDGGDLRGLLAAQGPMAPGALCRIMAQVMAGLAAIHAAGIVHRDVKPENILVDLSTGTPRAQISDFGIAWAADGPQVTGPSRLPGTTAYLAPEVIEGTTAGPAADVYAAGVTAYELACGRRPFTADTALAVLRLHVDQAPAPPPGVPERLWALVAACLRKDPADRPTAARLARAFTRLTPRMDGVPALVAPVDVDSTETPTLSPVLGKRNDRRRAPTPIRRVAAMGTAGVIGLAALSLVAMASRGGERGDDAVRASRLRVGSGEAATTAVTDTRAVEAAERVPEPDAGLGLPVIGRPPVAPPETQAVSAPPSAPSGTVATPASTLATVDPSAFRLGAGQSFARFAPWAAQLRTRLEPVAVGALLEAADRSARALCQPTSTPVVGFCWDEEDGGSTRWHPVGVTGSSDASGSGEYDGHRALMVGWVDRTGGAGLRVSFVRRDPGTPVRYQHVLLVEPTGPTDYRAVPAAGAGGLVWFEDRLYVADARVGLRVFDLRELWQANGDDPATVGRGSDGRYHAAGHRYVMAQVGTFAPPAGGACRLSSPEPASALCFSFLGLDRTTSPASLLTGERFVDAAGARLVRWPLAGDGLQAGSTGIVVATGAWRSAQVDLGGVVAYNDSIITNTVARPEPALWVERPDRSSARMAFPAGARGLTLIPSTGQLWTVTEEPGRRVVVAVPVAP